MSSIPLDPLRLWGPDGTVISEPHVVTTLQRHAEPQNGSMAHYGFCFTDLYRKDAEYTRASGLIVTALNLNIRKATLFVLQVHNVQIFFLYIFTLLNIQIMGSTTCILKADLSWRNFHSFASFC